MIGFVGLGNMGWPMAARLPGADLTVFDTRPELVERFAAEYGARAGTDLGAVDVLITMLPDGAIVRRVLTDAPLAPGTLVVDMSSSDPVGTRELGAELAARGVALVDAPVSGGVAKARTGELAIMAGGEPAAVDRAAPLLEPLGRVIRTGDLGSGHAMKALNNLLSAAGLLAAAEVVLVGRRFGLDPQVMIDTLNASTGRNNSTENKFDRFILSGSYDSGFAMALMVKDLRTALGLAHETRTPATLGQVCLDLWTEAQAHLPDGADHTMVAAWLASTVED